MNSWTNQNNMVVGQAQFNPYNTNTPYNIATQMQMYNNRAPVYRAEPIHGENAAWQFPIGGGEIYLPDADEDIIWWIRIDQNGNKNVTPFDVTPHVKPEPVDMEAIMTRLAALEEKVNAKQNKSNAKRSNNAAGSDTVSYTDTGVITALS